MGNIFIYSYGPKLYLTYNKFTLGIHVLVWGILVDTSIILPELKYVVKEMFLFGKVLLLYSQPFLFFVQKYFLFFCFIKPGTAASNHLSLLLSFSCIPVPTIFFFFHIFNQPLQYEMQVWGGVFFSHKWFDRWLSFNDAH